MKEFSRCPSCGCVVDGNLAGHHSAADCSILKYAERYADKIRRECADRHCGLCGDCACMDMMNPNCPDRAAIMDKEAK